MRHYDTCLNIAIDAQGVGIHNDGIRGNSFRVYGIQLHKQVHFHQFDPGMGNM